MSRLEIERKIVERYRLMVDASGRMLAAARRDDWDEVCAIEKECARLIEDLIDIGDLSPTDPALRQEKLELVRRVLADDAAIRLLSQPWLRNLDAMLRTPVTAARVNRAYGSGPLRG